MLGCPGGIAGILALSQLCSQIGQRALHFGMGLELVVIGFLPLQCLALLLLQATLDCGQVLLQVSDICSALLNLDRELLQQQNNTMSGFSSWPGSFERRESVDDESASLLREKNIQDAAHTRCICSLVPRASA